MSRKTGSVPEKTQEAILNAAAEEFYTSGFDKASLRTICTRAEVTTGALYGMFKDKEELFERVVAPVTESILSGMEEHFKKEAQFGSEEREKSQQEDLRAAVQILDLYYENRMLFNIILKNRERPCIKGFFDRLVEIMEEQMTVILERLPDDIAGKSNFNECTLHWLSHMQVDSVLHIISHDYEKERAVEQFRIIIKFLHGGMWNLAAGSL